MLLRLRVSDLVNHNVVANQTYVVAAIIQIEPKHPISFQTTIIFITIAANYQYEIARVYFDAF